LSLGLRQKIAFARRIAASAPAWLKAQSSCARFGAWLASAARYGMSSASATRGPIQSTAL
jgi:hypothetical protein